jgi:hypothetical protein
VEVIFQHIQIFSFFFFVVFFKGKIGIMKKSSQKFVSFLYIVIDTKYDGEFFRFYNLYAIIYLSFKKKILGRVCRP